MMFGFTSQIQCRGGKERHFYRKRTAVGGAWGQRGEGIGGGVDQLGAEEQEPEGKAGVGVGRGLMALGLGWR